MQGTHCPWASNRVSTRTKRKPAILPTARELGIGITAYCVLSRFQGQNLQVSLALPEALAKVAEGIGATVAQVTPATASSWPSRSARPTWSSLTKTRPPSRRLPRRRPVACPAEGRARQRAIEQSLAHLRSNIFAKISQLQG